MATSNTIPRQLADAVSDGDETAFALLMLNHPEHIWDPGTKNRTRWLVSAASDGQLSIIKILIEAGADINAPASDDSRHAPEGVIDTAASEGHLEVVRWLLDYGAIVNHVVNGQTRCFALTGAAFRGRLDVVKLLVERGAMLNAIWAGMTPLDHAMAFDKKEVVSYLRSVGGKTAKELQG